MLENHSSGVVTGIGITRSGPIRMRTCSKRYQHPKSRNDSQINTYSEKDIQSYAKQCLLDMQSGGDFGDLVELAGLSSKLIAIAKGCVQRVRKVTFLTCGWARRPKKGLMYGAKYIHLYQEEVEELFNRGEADSSNKLGPARMLEVLKRRYPDRYNLPGEMRFVLESWRSCRSQQTPRNPRKLRKLSKSRQDKPRNPKLRNRSYLIPGKPRRTLSKRKYLDPCRLGNQKLSTSQTKHI